MFRYAYRYLRCRSRYHGACPHDPRYHGHEAPVRVASSDRPEVTAR
ncbi:hypothetical protein [Nocardioides sp. GY 10127]|nr:hypothetical protein [Nocardioides sp. GY 10127]